MTSLSPPFQKSKKDSIEITPEQAKVLDNIPLPPEFKKRKLICRIWNEKCNRTLRKPVVIPYGKPYFSAKIGTKDRFFKVNYDLEGMIKYDNGKLYYDTVFDNVVGGVALRNYEFPEDMDSEEAYTTIKNNAVNMYVKKGGIPLLYLMVAMLAVIVMAIAIVATVPAGLGAQEQVKDLDAQVTQLKKDNAILAQQLAGANNG